MDKDVAVLRRRRNSASRMRRRATPLAADWSSSRAALGKGVVHICMSSYVDLNCGKMLLRLLTAAAGKYKYIQRPTPGRITWGGREHSERRAPCRNAFWTAVKDVNAFIGEESGAIVKLDIDGGARSGAPV